MSDRCEEGQWVEIERVLLEPPDRVEHLPADTAAQPLRMWVKGYARSGVLLGEECEVETLTGRTVAGALTAVNPGYTHTFGAPPPGIGDIGRDARVRVAAYRADERAGGDPRAVGTADAPGATAGE